MRLLLLALTIALSVLPALAQPTPGSCARGQATGLLDAAGVRARVFNTGSLFYGGDFAAAYEVPKGSGLSPILNVSLWVGGTVDGEVRTAAATYQNFEFWPGPINDGATLPNSGDCSTYDRIWVVSDGDVEAYEKSGIPTTDLAEWPTELGAPWTDADEDAVYDLAAGDRPIVYGAQTAFWVMNDVGNEHEYTGSVPLGIEVRVTAFTAGVETFYRYEVINRNAEPIEDVHLGLYSDVDLGNAADDYIGSDSTRGLAFAYNADGFDDNHYEGRPPAIGFDLFSGTGTARDVPKSLPPPLATPSEKGDLYRWLQGLWSDGEPLVTGGPWGYPPQLPPGGDTTRYSFPGDPVQQEFWSEVNIDGNGTPKQPYDRRLMIASPPFSLAPGERQIVDLGIIFARGADHLDSVTGLKVKSDHMQERYDEGDLFSPVFTVPGSEPPPAPTLVAPADGASFTGDSPLLEWTPLERAAWYMVELSPTPTFEWSHATQTYDASVPASQVEWPLDLDEAIYWRVYAVNSYGIRGPASEARALTYHYVIPSLLLIPAYHPEHGGKGVYLELAGPGGTPVCEPGDSSFGCAEYGGDFVNFSLNSTGEYFITANGAEGSEASAGAFAPYDFEIRFGEPSYGIWFFNEEENVAQVPFSVYDIGPEGTTGNDPSNDVRIVPILFADNGGVCEFEFGESTAAGAYPTTDRIYAYYATSSYEDWAAEAEALLGGDSNACVPGLDTGIVDLINFNLGRPIQRQVVADIATPNGTVADLAGAVIRFPTYKPLLTTDAEEDAPAEAVPQASALFAPYPNPARERTTIAFTLAQPGPARLVAYDVLGREVAVLVDGPLPAGEHTVALDGRPLAAGVYLLVLETDDRHLSRRLTVLH